MTSSRMRRILPPGRLAALALMLSTVPTALAQNTPGQGMSGTTPRGGAGTRTGLPLGVVNDSSVPGVNREGFPQQGPVSPGQVGNPPPAVPPGGEAIPLGPGVRTTYPGEMDVIPLDALDVAEAEAGPRANQLSSVTDRQLRYARQIPAAGDRSLALSRIASAAIFANQLQMADVALADASNAALLMTPGLVQDQRFTSIITALMTLAEAYLREGRAEAIPYDLAPTAQPGAGAPATPLPTTDRNKSIRLAVGEYRRASSLAQKLTIPTYRSEMMYRVADGMSFGSQSIVNEYPRGNEKETPRDASGIDHSFSDLPDAILLEAADVAGRIDVPVWRDQALYKVASAGAESRQYARAVTVARRIPSVEVRANALLKIAELQARRGDPEGATSTYGEAAQAVAAMSKDDPRAVLAGVLVDSLVSVGRFDDARSSVALYPDEERRMIAMGAIAESQGRRGSAVAALRWINESAPPRYRSWLYRQVNNGVIAGIEDNRRRDLTNRER